MLNVHDKDIHVAIQDIQMVLGLSGVGIDPNLKQSKNVTEVCFELKFQDGDLKLVHISSIGMTVQLKPISVHSFQDGLSTLEKLKNVKVNPKVTSTCWKSFVPIDRAKEVGKLKAMRKELVQMKRKRSQTKEMCFGEFGDLNNLLLISNSDDMDNVGTSMKKNAFDHMEQGIWHFNLNPKYPRFEMIVQIGNEFGSRFVMRTLAPEKWLEDVGKLSEEELDIEEISSYLRKNRYSGNIEDCEKAEVLDKAFCAVFETKYKHNVSSYIVESPKLPKPNNSYDCGVYVIKFMEASKIDKMKRSRNKILKLKLQLPYGMEVFCSKEELLSSCLMDGFRNQN
ncbi:hypothetical protein M9H77_27178 [Catharanthus roseus]|uniref:Uncharacterized protein n=1 Tax=Catharanthus roseus TaxID=4058 RepID=A0ACC0ADN8_CATRO|nr:hypothetical protein M9H77_27178 [Catharanthus roseus]